MTAEDKILERVAFLLSIKKNYLGYLQCRISDSDWHGSWDASVNIAETEAELAGLNFALETIRDQG